MENKIKIQDLSVGDWVCVEEMVGVHNEPRHTPPMKIVALGEDWVQLRLDPEQGDPFEYDISEIRGVGITPEILKSQGFIFEWGHRDYLRYRYSAAYLERRSENMWGFSSVYHHLTTISLRFVHQLQQALRLAGIEKEFEL